ncbi:hypothetical protein pzkkv8_288 [Klebsiella phage pzk-kv8]|nr:hypothetical protein pzkkv8_288 [Klebsiella phage pzk-kv8]
MDYRKHYDALIARAKTRKLESYKEAHHIIPRCMNGKDSSENLVDLTAEEHFVAHQLLAKIYPWHPGLIRACRLMCASSEGQVRNNKEFGWIKSRIRSLPGPMAGRCHSEETKLKMSKSSKGKPKTKEHKAALSKAFTGVCHITEEGKRRISERHTNKKVSKDTLRRMSESMIKINKEVTCPWCGKVGKLTGMKSWHFDRCKENPNGLQRSIHS